MNKLSGSDVLAEDKLFATLDPVARRVNYGSGEFLLVDTVGFINKLPHDLVNAFRATLEEAKYADLLLHIIDAASDEHPKQMEVVDAVLKELGAGVNPIITVYNKCDIAQDARQIAISAKAEINLDKLKNAVTQHLSNLRNALKVLLPLNAGATVSRIYATGKVKECEYRDDGIYIVADVPVADAARVKGEALVVYE
jgi:GTP-binding protein HflX